MTTGGIFGLIFVFVEATIGQEAKELVEEVTDILFQEVGGEHADVVQILEPIEHLGEEGQVAHGARILQAAM